MLIFADIRSLETGRTKEATNQRKRRKGKGERDIQREPKGDSKKCNGDREKNRQKETEKD